MNRERKRCPWSGNDPVYISYHDEEWGLPLHDDRKHFEFLVLESAQAGLSWLTILKRRENYRRLYADFDPEIVAGYDQDRVEELLNDPGIIRNRLKIEASVTNARSFLEVRKEFGSFDRYLLQFTGGRQIVNNWEHMSELPAKTEVSDAISKDMKKRGFRFIGSTTIYAHLQAAGIVNDHLTGCFRYHEVMENRDSGKK
ncbi:MAG: DNA-3-methyladenine glycosylase I [Bacteroidota bacterium]